MNGQLIGAISVCFGLVSFGISFNQLYNLGKRHGWTEPYTALWVALGVAITTTGIALLDVLIDLNAGLIALIAFACTGSPMIVGDAARYVKSQQHEIESLRDDEI